VSDKRSSSSGAGMPPDTGSWRVSGLGLMTAMGEGNRFALLACSLQPGVWKEVIGDRLGVRVNGR